MTESTKPVSAARERLRVAWSVAEASFAKTLVPIIYDDLRRAIEAVLAEGEGK